jgi:hypothetical protein
MPSIINLGRKLLVRIPWAVAGVVGFDWCGRLGVAECDGSCQCGWIIFR